MTSYLIFKSIHLISMVAWFAGLFYLVRLFVYHREAMDKPEHEKSVLIPQYRLMQKRLYKFICNPAMMLTWTFGVIMIVQNGMEWLGANPWLHVKILLVILLTVYHLYCKKIMKKLSTDETTGTSFGFRLFNEVPTLFLVAIILLAVLKDFTNFGYTFGAVIILAIALYFITRAYKNAREKN